MFVVRCHIADAGVQPDAVVFDPLEFEFGLQLRRLADLLQVRALAFMWPNSVSIQA